MTMRSISAATLLALAACAGGDKSPDGSAPQGAASTALATAAPAAAPAAGGPLGIVFDPATLNKGTKVGTVTADMLTLSRAADSSWIGSARFVGELTLTGRAIPHVDANVREVCFEPDSASAAIMPRWSGDTRRTWFCFANQ